MLNPYYILLISILWMGCDQLQETVQLAKPSEEPASPCSFYYHQGLKKNIYTKVEIEAEYAGGAPAYQRFLSKNMRYPEEQIDAGDLQSNVRMQFIIDTDGKMVAPGIQGKTDTSNFTPLEKEAVRILKLMPKWYPATCQGKKVASEVKRPMIICIREIEE